MAKTLEEHYGYLSDRAKVEQYRAAVEKTVRPGHVVLDLGCGTGLLGLMALRAGARKVYFVEEGSIIEVARRTVADAGFADRTEFFQANSFQLSLPERADVAICDHVGYFGFDYGILGLLADARQRFLKPNGVILPQQIDLLLAPIESEECRKIVGQWRDGSVPEEFGWIGTSSANTKHGVQLSQNEMLADAANLTSLELGVEATPFLSWTAEFSCARSGTLDGIAGWFDCRLCEDVRMTNAPAEANALDRPQAYLPLETTVQVEAGDPVRVTIMARHVDEVIGWVVELPRAEKRFAQSTFNGLLLDHNALARSHPDRTAQLSDRGRARKLVLSYCDGQRTVAEVQALVLRDHPDLFPSEPALSTFVSHVLAWDTAE